MAWADATHPVTGETVPRCQAAPGQGERRCGTEQP